MKKGSILLLGLLWSLSVMAQNLKLDYEPGQPLVLEHPTDGYSLFLFFPKTVYKNQVYTCKMYKVDPVNGQVLGESSAKIQLDGKDDSKVRVLTKQSQADVAFFAIENNDECTAYKLDWATLSVTKTDHRKPLEKQRFVSGVSNGERGTVIAYQNGKKEDFVLMYTFDESGQLKEHKFAVSKGDSENFDKIFKKFTAFSSSESYRPLMVTYGKEHDPEAASRRPKLYAGPQQVWMTFETEVANYQVMRLFTFDLEKDSVFVKKYTYGNGLRGEDIKGSSYIFDQKIFQVATTNSSLHIVIRSLADGAVLKQYNYDNDADKLTFANSPIFMPGRGSFGIEKEYESPKKFFRRFRAFKPSILVRKSGDDYLMCIGGFEEVNTGPSTMFGAPGAPMTMTGGSSYERVCSFYSAVNASTLEVSTNKYGRTLVDYYAESMFGKGNLSEENLLFIGQQHYNGHYDKSSDQYKINRIGDKN